MRAISVLSIVLCALLMSNGLSGQDIRFFFTNTARSATTSEVNIYATTTAGQENLAGYTVYFYYDNTETEVSGYDSSPTATDLGWSNNNESVITHRADDNPKVVIDHTGYFFFQTIDNTLNGDVIDETPTLLMTVYLDHSTGTAAGSDLALAETTQVPALQYVGSDFIGHDVIVVAAVLPVELVYFRANKTDGQRVHLNWQTDSELNNDHFVIERSPDGLAFQPIGQVAGAGTTHSTQHYVFVDEAPLSGDNYYRLRQVDFDGTDAFSEIRVVTLTRTKTADWTVFPNPASDFLLVRRPDTSEDAQLELWNVRGQRLLQDNIGGTMTHRLSIADFPAGVYWLKLKTRREEVTHRVIIQ